MALSEEEQRRCCFLGGCGCLTIQSRGKALAEQLTAWGNDAAYHLLREFVLIPRSMLTAPTTADDDRGPLAGGPA